MLLGLPLMPRTNTPALKGIFVPCTLQTTKTFYAKLIVYVLCWALSDCVIEPSLQDLKDYCRKAGKVTYADAHKRRVGEG